VLAQQPSRPPKPAEPWYRRPAVIIIGCLVAFGVVRARRSDSPKESTTTPQQPASPAITRIAEPVQHVKRDRLRPERVITWLTLAGFTCYVLTWEGYRAFYAAFNVSPEAVGISYPALIIPVAVNTAVIGIFVIGFVALIAPLGMRVSSGAARMLLPLGLLLVFVVYYLYLLEFSGEAGRTTSRRTGSTLSLSHFVALIGLFGFLLIFAAIGAIGEEKVRRLKVRWRHRWRVRRLRQRIAEQPTEEAKAAVVVEHVMARRRRRLKRARERRHLREASPAAVVLLVSLTALLLANFMTYLDNAAEHAARDVLAGKAMFGSNADLPAGLLLNVRARQVEVIAVESRFRSLEGRKLLYLGSKDGGHVLYDIANKKALLIPSGAIALQFGEADT
jgi:hypothetical protein